MYRRRTKAERHDRKVQRFEQNRPRNKYVIQRRKWWERARDAAHKFYMKYLAKSADEGENREETD